MHLTVKLEELSTHNFINVCVLEQKKCTLSANSRGNHLYAAVLLTSSGFVNEIEK